MADHTETSQDNVSEDDTWLVSVFARAAGPFVDSAFAERILKRLRRRARVRFLVIAGTGVGAGALTLWLTNLVLTTAPALGIASLKAPGWMSQSGSSLAVAGIVTAVLAAWMVVDET